MRMLDNPANCLEANGTRDRGYVIWGSERAHRVAYREAFGKIPAGFHVHHRCGNKACVNPDHLEALSPADHTRSHNPQTVPHGSRWRYKNHGCRCAECRAANTAWFREYRTRRAA